MKVSDRAFRISLLGFLAAATIVYRAAEIHQFFFGSVVPRMPGFGVNVERGHMRVSFVAPRDISGLPTPASKAGLKVGDRILAVYNAAGQGGLVRGSFEYGDRLRQIRRDESWVLAISRERGSGKSEELRVTLSAASEATTQDVRVRILVLMFFLILPWVAIIAAFFIGFMGTRNPHAFMASLLFLSFSTIFEANPTSLPPGFRELGLVYQTTLNSLLTFFFLRFFLCFPSPCVIERKVPWLKRTALAVALVIWVLVLSYSVVTAHDFQTAARLDRWMEPLQPASNIANVLMFLLGLVSLVLNTVAAGGKDERRRMVILLGGTLIGLVPLMLFIAYSYFSRVSLPPWWLIALVGATLGVFPLSFVYAVLRHRVLGIRVIVRRGLQYAFVSRGFLVVEAALIFTAFFFGVGPLLSRLFPDAGEGLVALATAVMTLAAVTVLRTINRRVMPAIDRHFFREAYNSQKVLGELSSTVRRLVAQPDRLLRTVTDTISDCLYPEHVALFLRGAEVLSILTDQKISGQSLIRFDPRTRDGFQFYWLRSRSASGAETLHARGSLEGLYLPAESFVVRQLEKVAASEPAALEVYLNDPRSWVGALVKALPQSRQLYQERLFLETLGTRLLVPLATRDHLLGFLSLGERLSEEPYSTEDKALLLTVAEQTAIALDYARLVGRVAEQERIRRELEIAKEVQAQLFPQFQPSMNTLDYTAVCRTAREVGGDYYDFLQVREHQLCVALGDISGKGISASLLMASLQALVRSHAPQRSHAPDELLGEINRLMCSSSDGSKYATLFCALYDDQQRTLRYVNAGHNPPILLRRDPAERSGEGEASLNGFRSIRLDRGGIVLGLFQDATYESETIQTLPGDLLVVYTDGVTEAFNAEGEEFGEERLLDALKRHAEGSAAQIRDAVLREVDAFVGEAPQHDDLTMMVFRVL